MNKETRKQNERNKTQEEIHAETTNTENTQYRNLDRTNETNEINKDIEGYITNELKKDRHT